MPVRSKRYAAIILITGSISSTSGAQADPRTCPAPEPLNTLEALAGLDIDTALEIRYREEVRHPALAEPGVASGVMRVAPGGGLVKDQRVPSREISEIGERFVSVRDAPEAEPNFFPIPDDVRPTLNAIRKVMAGNAKALLRIFDADLVTTKAGWQVEFSGMEATVDRIDILGCGPTLRGMAFKERGGTTRRLEFERR